MMIHVSTNQSQHFENARNGSDLKKQCNVDFGRYHVHVQYCIATKVIEMKKIKEMGITLHFLWLPNEIQTYYVEYDIIQYDYVEWN